MHRSSYHYWSNRKKNIKPERIKQLAQSTYNPSLFSAASYIVESSGRNIVVIDFTAEQTLGLEMNFVGKCAFESGNITEVNIEVK